jgi:hypothetical protein
VHKNIIFALTRTTPNFLPRDSFSFFLRAMRQNEKQSMVTQYECQYGYQQIWNTCKLVGRSIGFPFFELNGWSHIFVSGHQKDMRYGSHRFIMVCWSIQTLPLAEASTDSPTAYRVPKARRSRDFVGAFLHQKVVRTDFPRCDKWTRWLQRIPRYWLQSWFIWSRDRPWEGKRQPVAPRPRFWHQ